MTNREIIKNVFPDLEKNNKMLYFQILNIMQEVRLDQLERDKKIINKCFNGK